VASCGWPADEGEAAMMVIPNTASRVFYPNEMDVLGEAFRQSWTALSDANDCRVYGRQAHYARETMAKLIIGFASAGERDPVALSRSTLQEMNAL
jgi:hypothetical protein